MSVWDIYWLTRLEPLQDFFEGVAIFFGLSGCIATFIIAGCVLNEGARLKNFWWSVILFICCSFSSALSVLMPTKSDLAIIFAGQWVTNSEEMQKLPNNVARTINKFMSEYLEGEKKDD